MTAEIYTAPPAAWVSTRYTATVGGAAAGVWGKAATTGFATLVWAAGQTVEQSWLVFGSDASTEVRISLTGGRLIRSAVVYPKNVATQSISAGVLVLQVPANTRLRIEIDGDRANTMHVFSSPLAAALPASYTNWTTLSKTVSNVNPTTNVVTTSTAHGYSNGDKLLMASTGTLPNVTGSILTAYEQSTVGSATSTTFILVDKNGATVDFTDAGTGTITVTKASYTSSSSPLYFGAGTHVIGRLFDLATGVQVVIDQGALVIGSFDLREIRFVKIRGRGTLAGDFATRADAVAAAPNEHLYAMFCGYDGASFTYSNQVEGITVVNSPHYLTFEGVNSWTNVQNISPWNYNCDGFDCSEGFDNKGSVTDCFGFTGDDGCRMESMWFAMTVTNSFMVTSNGSPLLISYWGGVDQDNRQTVTNCHGMLLSYGGDPAIKCWVDRPIGSEAQGCFDIYLTNFKVWGPVAGLLFWVANKLYPFPGGTQYDQRGQIADWTIDGLTCEETPRDRSILYGYNATNTPHGLTFTDFTIAGTVVNDINWATYVDQNAFPYDITLDESSSLTVETGSVITGADAYCTRAFADTYHASHSNPTAWSSATEAQRDFAIREATAKLDERYGNRWAGYRVNLSQVLDWPRNLVVDRDGILLDFDTIPLVLQQATARCALLFLQGQELSPTTETTASVKSETLTSASGASKSQTFAGARNPQTQFPAIDRMLVNAGLVDSATGWGVIDL